MATGQYTCGSNKYIFDASGSMAASRWSLIDGNLFYDDPSGALHVGWLKLGNTWYYFDNASCEMKTGLIDVGDMRYFALDSGVMATSDWVFFEAGCALSSASGVLSEAFFSPPTVRHCWRIPTPYPARFMLAIRYFLPMRSVGGDLSPIAVEQNHPPWSGGPGRGNYLNAYRWFGYAIDSHANIASFNFIEELLRSGLARKGDLVFFIYIISMSMIVIADFSGATRQVRIYFGIVMASGIAS